MPQTSATRRLGSALQSAARRYGETVRNAEAASLAGSEARFLLARLGLPLRYLAPGDSSVLLPEIDRTAALARLRSESLRLARLARVRHPAYDLNRHIAVRRLLAALGGDTTRRVTRSASASLHDVDS